MIPSIHQIINEISIFLSGPFGNESKNFRPWLARRPLIATWGRREVYQSCLNRLPEFEIDWQSEYDSREHCAEHIAECITSYEFRNRAIEIIGSTMPWIPRTFFVHIPRTGGSSVKMAIEDGFCGLTWHLDHLDDDWFLMHTRRFGLDPLMFMLKFLGQFASPSASIFVVGHNSLVDLLVRGFVRAGDRVFTIIRPPEQIIFSALNHIVDAVTGQADTPDALDWREWFKDLEIAWSSGGQIRSVDSRRILSSERFIQEYANPITRYLSHDGTVGGAIAATSMVRCSVLSQRSMLQYFERELGLTVALGIHNSSRSQLGEYLKRSTADFVTKSLCNLDCELLRLYDESSCSFVPRLREEVPIGQAKSA